MINHILFLDIETVSVVKHPNEIQVDYIAKRQPLEDRDTIWDRYAALYAETGKVVCVSVAKVNQSDGKLRVLSFCSRHERELLERLAGILKMFVCYCAHNGKEFDFPFLYRRYLANGLPVPEALSIEGKKPWEIPHLDTMEMWSHMQWKHRAGLDMLANVFGLPSPKKDFSGADVGKVYYDMFVGVPNDELPFEAEQAALNKISNYCEGDVITLVNLMCKLKGLPIFTEDKIEHRDDKKEEEK